ncbi:MAG: decaprenyl-phosphate phosphoribosyltransferase [Desulfurivibrio sp.]|nr:MAG: decaprenyl-phosphate phosphoribosyltransferase [Desulfurivibrio sp.]
MYFLSVIKLLRPKHWLKNLLLFFPPFMAGTIFEAGMIWQGIVPFLAFSLAASSIYIINDIVDAKKDAQHPVKKNRPIPTGRVNRGSAAVIAVFFLIFATVAGYLVSLNFLLLLVSYFVITTIYSFKLKGEPIFDIFCISAGFLLRLEAGGVAFGIAISEWLFLSVFLLSIFLSTGKRLSEKKMLGQEAGSHRTSLGRYPEGFLEGAMYMTGAAVLVTYSMYVIYRPKLIYTILLCCFGLFRYIYLVQSGREGDPTESLLSDAPLFLVSFLWVLVLGWGIYR